jgi:hypothetical protein
MPMVDVFALGNLNAHYRDYLVHCISICFGWIKDKRMHLLLEKTHAINFSDKIPGAEDRLVSCCKVLNTLNNSGFTS